MSLSASVYVLQQVAERTKGSFWVPQSEMFYKEFYKVRMQIPLVTRLADAVTSRC